MNIGVLDDNPAILSFLGHALILEGHAVALHVTPSSLFKALMPAMTSDYEAVPYDLLVLDLLLPATISGIDVLREVRKHFQPWQLPVIVITALSGPTLEQYRRLLPDDVLLLRKPISLYALRRALAQMGEGVDLRHRAGGPSSS